MLYWLYPDEEADSAYKIDYEKLAGEGGIGGVIFDIDNTLVPHGEPADEQAVALFQRLRELSLDVVLLSNNKEPRVKSFADAVSAKYIYKAGKPGKTGYEKAMQQMGTDIKTTLFVGDQLFTDVWGAKNLGIHAVLVQPIDKKEEIQIVLKRYLEKIVLAAYRRACKKGGKEFLKQ